MFKRIEQSVARWYTVAAIAALSAGTPTIANATALHADLGGTFTTQYDREALAVLVGGSSSAPGEFLVAYFDTTQSDYTQFSDSYFYLGNTSRTEIPAVNLVHDITPISAVNPSGQAQNRYVKATTPNFAIDSETLTGTGSLGMTGVELFRGNYNGSLVTGDFSLRYSVANRQAAWDDLGQAGTPGGWYLQNNISFSMVLFDLANLSLIIADANNWQLSGDLLMSPENADFLGGARQADVGDFCLGVGSFAGCGQVTAVPVPAAVWLFGTGLIGLSGTGRRGVKR